MKKLVSLILCVCLIFAGVSIGNYSAYAAEPNIGCEMYSSNPNPLYAKKGDDVTLDVISVDAVTITSVLIAGIDATRRTGTSEWEIDGDFLWRPEYLDFEVTYSYVDEAGNTIDTTTNELTTGVAVLFDNDAPVNYYPTLHELSCGTMEAIANVSSFAGDVAPPADDGYSFQLFDEDGKTIKQFFGSSEATCLFDGLDSDTVYKVATKVKDAAGNMREYSGKSIMRTMSLNPESVSITGRTNDSLSYSMDRSNQSDGTENKVCLSDADGSISETAFGITTRGTFINLEEGKEYMITAIARNSASVESPEHMYWTGTTRNMPRGAIISPNGDVYMKADGTFVLRGTYEDSDGDEVSISAFIGNVEGIVTKDASTWSASWNAYQLHEGPQADICVAFSDDGGSGETKLTWQYELTVDRTAPASPNISASPSDLTSGSVLVSLLGEENASIHYGLDGATDIAYENPFAVDENVIVTAFQSDMAGNASTESSLKIDWIDAEAPIGTVSYSTAHLTNETVTATLTTDDENAVTITNNGGSDEYGFTSNGSFTFEFIDAAGNTGSSTAEVSWIDKEAPKGIVSYRTAHLTNETVTATLTTDDENAVTITNNGGSDEYGFTSNGSFTFEFIDAAGNTGSATAEVSWIDKEAPAPPMITTNPENGISRNSVEIILSQEQDYDVEAIDYRIRKSTESAWISYDKPFEISEKGTWILEVRVLDKAGNKSESSQRQLILRNARKREIEPSTEAVSRMDINLAYVLPSGTILDIKRMVTPYDEFGKTIENKSFTFESSNSSVLEILSDGSIIFKKPGSAYLTATDIGTGETFRIPLVIEATAENGSEAMTDIENHWAEDSIDDFCQKGFIRGYEDGSFRPENEITIEECIAILERVRLRGSDLDYAPRKSDLPEITAGDWSLCYDLSSFSRMDIDILRDAFGDDLFLSRPITRGEAALLLDQSEHWDNPNPCDECPFTDLKTSSFIESINKAYARGLIKGYPDGTFRPDAYITRAEMTILFCRFIELL